MHATVVIGSDHVHDLRPRGREQPENDIGAGVRLPLQQLGEGEFAFEDDIGEAKRDDSILHEGVGRIQRVGRSVGNFRHHVCQIHISHRAAAEVCGDVPLAIAQDNEHLGYASSLQLLQQIVRDDLGPQAVLILGKPEADRIELFTEGQRCQTRRVACGRYQTDDRLPSLFVRHVRQRASGALG